MTNGTCKPRPPGTLHTAYSLCKTNAVAVLSWWMNGPKSLSNKLDSIYSANIWLAAKGYDGVAFAVDWTRVKVALLAYQVYDGVMVALDWSWVQVKWLVWNACYATMWTAYWICYIVWRIGSGIWIKIVWIGDALAYFYYLHLESKLFAKYLLSRLVTSLLPTIARLSFSPMKAINCVNMIPSSLRGIYQGPWGFCDENSSFNFRVHIHQCSLPF